MAPRRCRTLESSQTEESPETATTAPLPGTVPAVAGTGEMRGAVAGEKGPLRLLGAWHLPQKSYGFQVHGTCRKNPRDFIGIRISWCDTGDSPRRHGGSRATAAVGWTLESSQTEESPETATTAPLPGTVPAVADARGNEAGRSRAKNASYGPEVHGTCSSPPSSTPPPSPTPKPADC